MEVEHDLVLVDEFDALSIQIKGALAAPRQVERFPAKTHARKVAKELQVKNGLIYLPGQSSLLYEDSDMAPAFRQLRYFYYLSGANFANCFVTYDIAGDSLVLWIPYTDPREVLWMGRTPGIEECKQRIDIDDVRLSSGLQAFLQTTLGATTPLFLLHAAQAPELDTVMTTTITTTANSSSSSGGGTTTTTTPSHTRKPASQPSPKIDSTRLQPAMDAARVLKTPYEIAQIRRANAVSSAAHRAVLRRLATLRNEREVDALFRGFCTAHGAPRQAYPVIAGAGANAASLHYDDNDQPLAGKQVLVLDAGCEWGCYASDVTRTLPLSRVGDGSGSIGFTPEAAAVYALVQRMQDECLLRAAPGADFLALFFQAHWVAVHGLQTLGILRRDADPLAVLAAGTTGAFFPHGLGHQVGLEVHDVVCWRESSPLRPGGGSGGSIVSQRRRSSVSGRNGSSSGSTRRRPGAGGKRDWLSPETVSAMCRDGMLALSFMAPTASSPFASCAPRRQQLETNMVVTVEPGIYFCREYIDAYFLSNPVHAKFIDTDVLEKYYPVGGVRIEDDILIVNGGYENLTTAPKGEEALEIINGR